MRSWSRYISNSKHRPFVRRKALKRLHCPLEIMLVCVRWYAAYPLSLRNLEQMMAERGVIVDHATVHRWALKILRSCRCWRRCFVGASARWDRVGAWTRPTSGSAANGSTCIARSTGSVTPWTSCSPPSATSLRRGAFFERAIDLHDVPEKITIDKSGANTAAVNGLIADSGVAIELRQSKYLNNLVEQDHRAIKRRTRPMLGFKDFWSAAKIIAGIETMHMIRKGQSACPEGQYTSAAEQFYSLAF